MRFLWNWEFSDRKAKLCIMQESFKIYLLFWMVCDYFRHILVQF
jgi:hypothetical protein